MQEVGTLGCPSFASFPVISTHTPGTPACQTLYALWFLSWARQTQFLPFESLFSSWKTRGQGNKFHDYVFNCSKYQDLINTKMVKHMELWVSGVRYLGRLPGERNISVEIWKEKMNYVKEGRRVLGRKDSKRWVPEVERSVPGCKGRLVLDECKKTGGEKMPDHAEEASSQITQVI